MKSKKDAAQNVVEELVAEANKASRISNPYDTEMENVTIQDELANFPIEDNTVEWEGEEINENDELIDVNFSHIPADSNYYVKIYQVQSGLNAGSPMFKMDISRPENCLDFTTTVQELAVEHGWGDGEYVLKLIKQGVKGIVATKKVNIWTPKEKGLNGTLNNPTENLSTTINNLKKLQDITSGMAPSKSNTPEVNPSILLDTLQNAVKIGVETANNTAARQPEPLNPVDLIKLVKELQGPENKGPNITEMLTAFSTILATQKAPEPPPQPSILEQFKQFKELGLLGEKKQDSELDNLLKFKTIFEQPKAPPPPDPTAKALELLTSLGPVMQAMGGGKSENTSVGVELIRNLGPQLGNIFSSTMGTIKTAIEAKAGVLANQSQKVPGGQRVKNASQGVKKKLFSRESLILPILRPLHDAVKQNDTTYYPQLYQLLVEQIGKEEVANIITGTTTVADVQAKLSPISGGVFNSQQATMYFNHFVQWMRTEYQKAQEEQGKTAEIVDNSVRVTCSNPECGLNYQLNSIEELTPDLKCPSCNALIVLQNEGVKEIPEIEQVLTTTVEDKIITDTLSEDE